MCGFSCSQPCVQDWYFFTTVLNMRHKGQGQIIRCFVRNYLCIMYWAGDWWWCWKGTIPCVPEAPFFEVGTHAVEDPKFFLKKMLVSNHWYIILWLVMEGVSAVTKILSVFNGVPCRKRFEVCSFQPYIPYDEAQFLSKPHCILRG